MSKNELTIIEPAKKKSGRPRLDIDPEEVIKLSKLHCSMQEMADFFDCHVDTLRDNYSKEITKGRTEGNIRLRRKQWQIAIEKGNVIMLIWLGKQLLGQANEKIEGDSNMPLPIYDIINNEKEIELKKVDNDK
jgi:hypothetical protein